MFDLLAMETLIMEATSALAIYNQPEQVARYMRRVATEYYVDISVLAGHARDMGCINLADLLA